ncbi:MULTISPECIES: ABC transporter permease [Microbacterium]|uniref:ABC transporter permease n=1 Tax=Microbacterium TaxID=33882 RepID=UPI0028832C63|nr:ABC transporter permease subunit [Microbacterium sp. WCS2018Hpa-23]
MSNIDTHTLVTQQARSRRAPAGLGQNLFAWGALLNPLGLIAVVVGILLWQLVSAVSGNYYFPTASQVAVDLGDMIVDGTLANALGITLGKALLGVLIGGVAGLLIGRLMVVSRYVADGLGPLVNAVYPIPRLALYPLLVVAFGAGGEATILLVSIEAFFPILYSTQVGAGSLSQRYRWLMGNTGASYLRREGIAMRAITPYLVAGLRNAVPTALIVVVTTELLLGSSGAGFLARDAGNQFLPARSLAVVFALGVVGVLLNIVMRLFYRRTQRWNLSLQA